MLVDQFLRHVVWGSLDVLLIDTPPSVGDVHSALLDTLRVLPASTVLLVAEEGSAASAAATRCDAIFCRAKHIRVAGIVGTKTRGVVPDGDGNDGGGGCDDDGHCSKYTGWLGVWLVAHHALTPDGFMDGWIHGWMSPVCCHVWLAAPHQTQT